MDTIKESAVNFKKLLSTEYEFVLSLNRKISIVSLDFHDTDFYHLVGLKHLDDIDIDRNPHRTLDRILNDVITDDVLSLSSRFSRKANGERNIQSRISSSRYLERFLDENNFIYIYERRDRRNTPSAINAEYVIRSDLRDLHLSAYIFLRKRSESEKYCVVSFFERGNSVYTGTSLYWMEKKKTSGGKTEVLYRHPEYQS